jgi:hypothetical protein
MFRRVKKSGEKKMKFKVGKYYRTRGGWKAKVIWKLFSHTEMEYYKEEDDIPIDISLVKSKIDIYKLVVIHKPDEEQKSNFGMHDSETGTIITIEYLKISNNGPAYGQEIKRIIEHPADLVEEWKDD